MLIQIVNTNSNKYKSQRLLLTTALTWILVDATVTRQHGRLQHWLHVLSGSDAEGVPHGVPHRVSEGVPQGVPEGVPEGRQPGVAVVQEGGVQLSR